MIKKKESKKKSTVVSLFSGCGGLDLGFSDDFFEISAAYDIDQAAIDCIRHNLKCKAEVLDVSTDKFDSELDKIGKADIVLGGFPCQGFSKAGPKKKKDPRNLLYLSMLKAVERLQPYVFVAENVDGMAQNFKGEYLKLIQNDFEKSGYIVESRILNAVNFGVPQYRRRVFFVGIKKTLNKTFEWPKPTHFGGSRNGEFKTEHEYGTALSLFEPIDLKPSVTLKDALSDLLEKDESYPDHEISTIPKTKDLAIMESIGEGKKLCNVRFSDTSVYTWQIPKAFGKVSNREIKILETIGKNRRKKIYGSIPNGNPLSPEVISDLSKLKVNVDELNSLAERGFLKKRDEKYDLKGAMFCSGLYKRPKWNEPAPTILTVFHSARYFFHPQKLRPFTLRECARMQSFPDSFVFKKAGVTIDDGYRLVGNAVPPLLASKMGESVRKILERKENEA